MSEADCERVCESLFWSSRVDEEICKEQCREGDE